jgi:hypothetical protein
VWIAQVSPASITLDLLTSEVSGTETVNGDTMTIEEQTLGEIIQIRHFTDDRENELWKTINNCLIGSETSLTRLNGIAWIAVFILFGMLVVQIASVIHHW